MVEYELVIYIDRIHTRMVDTKISRKIDPNAYLTSFAFFEPVVEK